MTSGRGARRLGAMFRTSALLAACAAVTCPAPAPAAPPADGHCTVVAPITIAPGGRFSGGAGNVRCQGALGVTEVDPFHRGRAELSGRLAGEPGSCPPALRDGTLHLVSSRLISFDPDPSLELGATWSADALYLSGTGVSEGRAIALSGPAQLVPQAGACATRATVRIELLVRDDGPPFREPARPAGQAPSRASTAAPRACPRAVKRRSPHRSRGTRWTGRYVRKLCSGLTYGVGPH